MSESPALSVPLDDAMRGKHVEVATALEAAGAHRGALEIAKS